MTGGVHGGILGEQIGDRCFERIELAGSGARNRRLVRLKKVLLDGVPARAQVAFNLSDRPALA